MPSPGRGRGRGGGGVCVVQFFPVNFFLLLNFCLSEKFLSFGFFIVKSDEHQNIPSSVMLEPFCIWTAQPSLELMVGTAAACHGQISVKPEYN